MNIEIRQEAEADHAGVYKVNQAAFGQDNEPKLVEALRKSPSFIPGLSLVAAADNIIAGHILFTRIRIRNNEGKEFSSLSLAPLAVMPAYQNKGIGGMLIRIGLQRSKEMGHESVIVLGHESYYPKFGFAPAAKWNIKAPYEVPTNAFMAIELVPGALKHVYGMVIFPREFDSV